MPDDAWKQLLENLKGWVWVVLVLAGVAVLGVALAIWLVPEDSPTKTVSELSSVSVSSSGSTETSAGATGQSGQVAPSSSETISRKTNKTIGPDKSRRSDTLLVALIGIGAGLVLAGAFFDRISSLKFAGVELTLQAKLAEKFAAATTPTTPEEREKAQAAWMLAWSRLPPETSPGDDAVIDAAVLDALSTVGLTSSGDDVDDSRDINRDFE
jgi:cytoskeletal protein RodZ